jgi:hypothetical protein
MHAATARYVRLSLQLPICDMHAATARYVRLSLELPICDMYAAAARYVHLSLHLPIVTCRRQLQGTCTSACVSATTSAKCHGCMLTSQPSTKLLQPTTQLRRHSWQPATCCHASAPKLAARAGRCDLRLFGRVPLTVLLAQRGPSAANCLKLQDALQALPQELGGRGASQVTPFIPDLACIFPA